jgi:dTDP-L-rhamnose 4-epimerase
LKILVTGGAGFIGSHVVDALLGEGHHVRVLDSLDPQVHGDGGAWPDYLNPEAERLQGDVRDPDVVRKALDGVEVVYHKAAAVGVGQSMYEISRYVSVNTLGAAVLLEEITRGKSQVERVVVASSMSIYGEGLYVDFDGHEAHPQLRSDALLRRGEWELLDAKGRRLKPVRTPETKPIQPTSVYAVTKRDHEELFLCVGNAYKIPTVALRYFNVYGSRQALSNPYTGVIAIFSARLLNDNEPMVTEDGLQSRDFVHVSDVAQANVLALRCEAEGGRVYNVGTGHPTTVCEIAELLADRLGLNIKPNITHKFREGDVRHCFSDITRAREELGFEPQRSLSDGIGEVIEFVREQTAIDRVDQATEELARRGLIH